jgi:hypothetical protein
VSSTSFDVGTPREVEWDGSPVAAKLPVRRLNIDGDGQAELGIPSSAKLGSVRRWEADVSSTFRAHIC